MLESGQVWTQTFEPLFVIRCRISSSLFVQMSNLKNTLNEENIHIPEDHNNGEITIYEYSMNWKLIYIFVSKIAPWVVVSGDMTLERIPRR